MHKELNRSGFYYGFPVLLATTKDQKGRDNITVLSSSWTLGDSVVLGIGVDNKGYKNIQKGSDITLNLCDESLLEAIKKIVVVFQKLKKLSWDFKHRVCLFDAGTGSVHKH